MVIGFTYIIFFKLFQKAIDLLEKMLDPDPETRISVEKLLKHEFFCSENYKSFANIAAEEVFLTPQQNIECLSSSAN